MVEAWRGYAEALVRAGRVDAAIGVLGPHLRGGRVLGALVEATEGQGRERVLELLAPIADEFRCDPNQCDDLWGVLPAQARVLERSGRADQAIRLLGADVAARRYGSHNNVEFYAELLARHGRVEELRDLADTERHSAVHVTALENLGRGGEAEAYLRDLIAAKHPGWYESALMGLLIRQGRVDDAVEAVEHTFDDLYDGNLLQAMLIVLADRGLHDRALGLTEGRSPEFLAENEEFWLRSNRWWLMGESGHAREEIAEIQALPADRVEDREVTIAWLLAQDGRIEEAIALLRPLPGERAATDLAELLIRQGRLTEAIAVIPDVAAQREEKRRHQPGIPTAQPSLQVSRPKRNGEANMVSRKSCVTARPGLRHGRGDPEATCTRGQGACLGVLVILDTQSALQPGTRGQASHPGLTGEDLAE
ncbi:hypothetical protein [Streptomyces sp. NPDC007206]|uniref:hypothetical protein n=1 Tax=Streptomyces sp. NPDC007206 TaxID=3154317 RepID=UPI0033E141DA